MSVQIEYDTDTARKLLAVRRYIKELMQISFDARWVDRNFPAENFDMDNADRLIPIYRDLLKRLITLSDEVKKNGVAKD